MVDDAGGASEPAGQPQDTRLSATLEALEHATMWIEKPVRKAARSNRLNPLAHAGTISVFLLGAVVVSGFYITLFFEFGHDASYNSVAGMEAHAIQKVARAFHRYSSAALVLTTLIHGWRVFVAGRFTGRARRWRWASGVASLVLVWLAGVTGYWLIWDVRAQALSEATIALLRSVGWGTGFAVHELAGIGESSGSGFLLLLWFVHLGLTAMIGWFTFRHLRRSRLPWFPPRHWMILMGGALLLVSLALPVGMLDAARPDQTVTNIALDPFILFLLPPLLSSGRWIAVIVSLGLVSIVLTLPRLLRRADPAPIIIDADACTGCELCVIDCPYVALEMRERDNEMPIAVVDPLACVACGICVGSCTFDAIELPGSDSRLPADVKGKPVVIACERHLAHSTLGEPAALHNGVSLDATIAPEIVGVRCAGAFAPQGVRSLMEAGATSVQLVGCAPSDCRYGIGNQLASERLHGERSPHPARRWSANTTEDWVVPSELTTAITAPGEHRSVDASTPPAGREAILGAGAIVALSVAGIAFATRAPFSGDTDQAAIRVIVDHQAGLTLRNLDDRAVEGAAIDTLDAVDVTVDGIALDRYEPKVSESSSVGLADWTLDPGLLNVEATVMAGDRRIVVHSQQADLKAGQRLLIVVDDVPPPPGAREGRKVFEARATGCAVCHSTTPSSDGIGPSLSGIASVAGERVEGLDAELYLRQSILLPDEYIVDGYRAGQMLPTLRDQLSAEELDALIVYLLTLAGEEE